MLKNILIFLVVIAIAQGFRTFLKKEEPISQEKVQVALDQKMSELERQAESLGGDKTEAMQKIASQQANALLNAQKDQESKKQTALNVFMGFYLINERSRKEYCQQQGVDISPFSDEFARLHRNEYTMLEEYLQSKNANVNQFYQLTQTQLKRTVTLDMESIANNENISTEQACQLFVEAGQDIARNMLLQQVQPQIYQAIHQTSHQ